MAKSAPLWRDETKGEKGKLNAACFLSANGQQFEMASYGVRKLHFIYGLELFRSEPARPKRRSGRVAETLNNVGYLSRAGGQLYRTWDKKFQKFVTELLKIK